jgi:hypothetical protein
VQTLEEDILDFHSVYVHVSVAVIRTNNSGNFTHLQLKCYNNCADVSQNYRSKSVGHHKYEKWVVQLVETSGPL